MASVAIGSALDIQATPFPARSRSTSGIAANHLTTITSMFFTDKLLITVHQSCSRSLSHWVQVPLSTASGDPMNPNVPRSVSTYDMDADVETSLLPRADLTATTILGGTKREDEVVGQTLATMIGSAFLVQRPTEERVLVLGLGLVDVSTLSRQGFEELVGLVLDCL